MGGLGLWQGLAYARVGQTEIVVAMEDGHLLPQPVFALAQRADPSPDRGDMLPDGEVDPLHEGGIDVPAMRRQHGIDGLQRAKHHAMTDPYQTPSAHGLDHLGIEQLGPRHPARLGHGPLAWRRGGCTQSP